MTQKIAVISFDHWNYDAHIVKALQQKGVESFHVKIGNFKYKSNWERVGNAFNKVFLNKNPKHIKRQNYILEQLQGHGIQDQILVINPELIDLEYHIEIKKYTKKYIAYLYDSVSRCSVTHLLDGVFDEIYSFDIDDCKKYGFSSITNYIYFDKPEVSCQNKQDFIYIGSIDNRLKCLNDFGEILKKQKRSFVFYAIGKKAYMNKLKQLFLRKNLNIVFKKNRFSQEETLKMYEESDIIVDLVRGNQAGLSFRIFEAIGLQKKMISNNKSITFYDIYTFGKIFFLDDLSKFNEIAYKDDVYSNELFSKYHINSWIQKVFKV